MALAARADPHPARRPARLPDPRGGVVLLRAGRRGAHHHDRAGEGHEPAARRRRRGRLRDQVCSAGLGSFPAYFLAAPRGEPPRSRCLRRTARRCSLRSTVAEVARARRGGALIVDVRPGRRVRGRAHPGVAVDPAARRVRHLARLARPIPAGRSAFVLDAGQDRGRGGAPGAQRSATSSLAGELAGGIDAWTGRGPRSSRIALVAAAAGDRTWSSTSGRAASSPPGTCPAPRNIELGAARRRRRRGGDRSR